MSFHRIHHVGVTVQDLETSLKWYRSVLEIEPDFVATGSGEELSRAVDCAGTELSFAFMRVGDTNLELLQYHSPEGAHPTVQNCDVGAVHIAISTDNIDTDYVRLTERGAQFSSPPIRITEGPLAGCAFVYFRDPDRVQLELFEDPR